MDRICMWLNFKGEKNKCQISRNYVAPPIIGHAAHAPNFFAD